MKNFASYVSKKMIEDIIDAHQSFIANAIDPVLLRELKTLDPEYLPNLKCSDDLKNFLDGFITDIKEYNETGEGTLYAAFFAELQK